MAHLLSGRHLGRRVSSAKINANFCAAREMHWPIVLAGVDEGCCAAERTFVSLSDIIERGQANGLASLKLAELRQVAAAQGLKGTSKLRKGDLVAAIENAGKRGGAVASDQPAQKADKKAEKKVEQRSERN